MKRSYRCFAALVLALLLGEVMIADAAPRRKRERRDTYRIRNIRIDPRNVFDPSKPGEDRFPFTWANFLHIRTRPHVIAREILIKPGDLTKLEDIEESERKLRALNFIKDADISLLPLQGDEADLDVVTQDAWTTQPQINFGSEGGESRFSTGILEENVFGFGKTLSLFYRKDKDGAGKEFAYTDPQLLGSRWTLDTLLEDSILTEKQKLIIDRPFYAPLTRYAGGVSSERSKEVTRVFVGGSESNRYIHETYSLGSNLGMRLNDDVLNVHRAFLRYSFKKEIYRSDARTLAGTLPENRTTTGPALEWNFRQSDFIKETFVDAVERVEDYNLGHEGKVVLGWSTKRLGATRESAPFTLRDSFGWGAEGPGFGLINLGINGTYNYYSEGQVGGRLIDTVYFYNTTYYRHLHEELPFIGVVNFETAYLQHSDTNAFLELGGDRGLRGFKNRAFTGNKSALVNVESRFFYPYELLHLMFLGGAVFADAGQVQQENRPFRQEDIHVNIGVGLRIGLTRSSDGSMFRIDLAYGLGKVPGDSRLILSLSTAPGFKRSGNAYALP